MEVTKSLRTAAEIGKISCAEELFLAQALRSVSLVEGYLHLTEKRQQFQNEAESAL